MRNRPDASLSKNAIRAEKTAYIHTYMRVQAQDGTGSNVFFCLLRHPVVHSKECSAVRCYYSEIN